jgi:hypothetical protein
LLLACSWITMLFPFPTESYCTPRGENLFSSTYLLGFESFVVCVACPLLS